MRCLPAFPSVLEEVANVGKTPWSATLERDHNGSQNQMRLFPCAGNILEVDSSCLCACH